MQGRVARSPGLSSGIGRATAHAFAAKGARVVVAARREHELTLLVDEIEAAGGQATAVVTDVSDARDVERMVAHAINVRTGRLDCAVNNAGIEEQFASITELAEEEWDRVLGINLKGTFLCLQHEVRAMLAGGHPGAIVNIGSIKLVPGLRDRRCVRHLEARPDRVYDECLGREWLRDIWLTRCQYYHTSIHQRLRGLIGDDIYDKGVLPQVHLQRAGRPEEIAQAVVFLCSDESSYITGTTLTPDGGFTLTV